MKQIILILSIALLLLIISCTTKAVGFTRSVLASPDNQNEMAYRYYSLGVFGGGYFQIEINNIAYIKFSGQTVVHGRWKNNNEIILLTNTLPVEILKESNQFIFDIQLLSTIEDVKRDSLLIRLNGEPPHKKYR